MSIDPAFDAGFVHCLRILSGLILCLLARHLMPVSILRSLSGFLLPLSALSEIAPSAAFPDPAPPGCTRRYVPASFPDVSESPPVPALGTPAVATGETLDS